MVTAMPWKEKGEIVGFAHMARVITERKRGELASAVAAREKAAIVDVTCDGLIVTDLDGDITSVNKAMEEYLAKAGYEPKAMIDVIRVLKAQETFAAAEAKKMCSKIRAFP